MYRKKEKLPILSQRLRILRKTADMTQQQLSDLLHVERCTYAFYETGKSRPDLGLLLRIARIYKVSADTLIDPDKDPFGITEGVVTGTLADPTKNDHLRGAIYLSQRDKSEKEMLVLFRQLDADQQLEVLSDLTRKLTQSEEDENA